MNLAPQVSKPAICLVNKMDNATSEANYKDFLKQLSDNRNEEYLKNLPLEARPEKLVDFHEVIPISAKFNPASVNHVKERLRKVIDEYEDTDKQTDEKVKELALSFDGLTKERNPKLC